MGLFWWHSLRRAGNTAPVAAAAESGGFRRVALAGIRNASSTGSRAETDADAETEIKTKVLHRRQNAPQQRQSPHQYPHQYPSPVRWSKRNLTTQISALAQRPLLPGRNQSGTEIETRRSLSFYGGVTGAAAAAGAGASQPNMGNAAYTVYGEEVAFGVKAIPPEFRALPSGTVVLDASKRGRFLLEWTPMDAGGNRGGDTHTNTRKFRWDSTTRFALTAEEAASLLARLDRGDPSVEFSRRMAPDHPQNPVGRPLDKVFVAKAIVLQQQQQQESNHNHNHNHDIDEDDDDIDEEDETRTTDSPPKPNGISLLVDYVDPDQQRFGQIPHPASGGGAGGMYDTSEGFRGPFEIRLMIGEYHVLRSILKESIPKLVGWTTMFDRNIEQAIAKSLQGSSNGGGGGGGFGGNYRGGGGYSPHNYQGGGGGSGTY